MELAFVAHLAFSAVVNRRGCLIDPHLLRPESNRGLVDVGGEGSILPSVYTTPNEDREHISRVVY